MTSLKKTLLTAAMVALAACQQPATGPKYQGEPLFTVKGELALTGPGTAPAGPIRLAVAWYPNSSAASAPTALVTQEVQYQGSFPLSYSFSFSACRRPTRSRSTWRTASPPARPSAC
jgi:hypothetical protein